MKLKKPIKEDIPYSPIIGSRILQILDSEKRFGVPYGTKSPFSFAFRDNEFRKASNRSYKYYMELRLCKTIKEYRQHVEALYKDTEIDIEVNGEARKFPIQMIPIPEDAHKGLIELAVKSHSSALPPLDVPLVFLSSIPVPRLLASPPTGRYRNEFLTEILTNKIIDFGIIVPETEAHLGIKYLGSEISKSLAPVEAIVAYAGEFSKRLKEAVNRPVGISLRGTVSDNPALFEDAFRVPISCPNFWETVDDTYWPTLDIDIDLFCGTEDFNDIFKTLGDPALFADTNNVKVNGMMMNGETKFHEFRKDVYDHSMENTHEFLKENGQKHLDVYIMTDEWVFKSIQRHQHLGMEQPWAYYYATSYPLLFDDWDEFLESLYNYMH